MTTDDDHAQIVNLSYFRRDLYLLVALFLSDKEVASIDSYREISEIVVESEVNHLLIGIAIASRQLLDTRRFSVSDDVCGEMWERFSEDWETTPSQVLGFRKACNIIIHAVEILPYDDPELGYFTGSIVIRGRRQGRTSRINRANLDFRKFSECCIELIQEFSQEVSMATNRTVYKYHFKLGNRIVHTGITNDLDRREAEHQRKSGWGKGHITQVGLRTTPEAAKKWEDEQRRNGKPTGP